MVTFLITLGFHNGEALTCGDRFAASPGIKSSFCTLTLRFPFWSLGGLIVSLGLWLSRESFAANR